LSEMSNWRKKSFDHQREKIRRSWEFGLEEQEEYIVWAPGGSHNGVWRMEDR